MAVSDLSVKHFNALLTGVQQRVFDKNEEITPEFLKENLWPNIR